MAAQVDLERAVATQVGALLGLAFAWVEHDVGACGVAVPGHELGALPGVGRGELLTDQRVQQGGLACLDLAGDGQPDRPSKPVEDLAASLPRPAWFVLAGRRRSSSDSIRVGQLSHGELPTSAGSAEVDTERSVPRISASLVASCCSSVVRRDLASGSSAAAR